MKKYLVLAIVLVGLSASAESISTNINPGTMLQLMPLRGGFARVSQVLITATTSTNSVVNFYDNTTNLTYRIQQPYTNTVSYVTNIVTSWTNYFGVVNTMTNTSLVDNTNNVVALSTNNISPTITIGTAGGTSTRADTVSYYFHSGIWVTNSSSGAAAVSITYQQ